MELQILQPKKRVERVKWFTTTKAIIMSIHYPIHSDTVYMVYYNQSKPSLKHKNSKSLEEQRIVTSLTITRKVRFSPKIQNITDQEEHTYESFE